MESNKNKSEAISQKERPYIINNKNSEGNSSNNKINFINGTNKNIQKNIPQISEEKTVIKKYSKTNTNTQKGMGNQKKETQKKLRNSMNKTIDGISNDINSAKKEIQSIKKKNELLQFKSGYDNFDISHRRIDENFFMENISAIQTSNDITISEQDSFKRNFLLDLSELTEPQKKLFFSFQEMSIPKLLDEINKRNNEIQGLENKIVEKDRNYNNMKNDLENKIQLLENTIQEMKHSFEETTKEYNKKIEIMDDIIKDNQNKIQILENELTKEINYNEKLFKKYDKEVKDIELEEKNITEIINKIKQIDVNCRYTK